MVSNKISCSYTYIFFFLFCALFLQISSASELVYVINKSNTDDKLNIEMTFEGSLSGSTKLFLTNKYPVSNMKVTSSKAVLTKTNIKQLPLQNFSFKHPPNETIKITYSVNIVSDNIKLDSIYDRIVVLDKNSGVLFANGLSFLLFPVSNYNFSPIKTTIKWKGFFDNDFFIGGTFPSKMKRQDFLTSNFDNSRSIYFIVDNKKYDIYPFKLDTKKINIVKPKGLKTSKTDIIKNMLSYGYVFAKHLTEDRDNQDPYFRNILVLPDISGKIPGTSFLNCFAVYANADNFKSLVLHEALHYVFFGSLIKQCTYNKLEKNSLWFFEGFTEYFTNELLLENKEISLEEYLKKYNNILWNVYRYASYTSNYNVLNNSDITSKHLTLIPYYKGMLFAKKIAYLIEEDSGLELKDVFLDLLSNKARQNCYTSNDIILQLQKFTKADVKKIHREYILDGKILKHTPKSMGQCIKMENTVYSVKDFSIDTKASINDMSVIGLMSKGKANELGLVEGQKIAAYEYSDDKNLFRIKVSDGEDGYKWLNLPKEEIKYTVPQYTIDKACNSGLKT